MTPKAQIRQLKKRVKTLQQSALTAWQCELHADMKADRLRDLLTDFDQTRCELHEAQRQLAQIPMLKREIALLKRKLKQAGAAL